MLGSSFEHPHATAVPIRNRSKPTHGSQSLRWVFHLADSSGRLARWRLPLAEYDYEVQYCPGIKHQLVDGAPR